MSTAVNANQRLLDLLGITGENICAVSVDVSALQPLPRVTVTSYLQPLTIELQTATAHFHLVPVSDEPAPLDFEAMAADARARCSAYIEDRTAYHQQQYKKSCRAAHIRRMTQELHDFLNPDHPLGQAYERRTTRQVVISGGSRIGKSWVSNLFDGWISPLVPQ